MTLAVGVIGTGIMGADHAKTLHHTVSGVEVTMVADVDLGRARGVAATLPGARATADGFALIDDDGVDAIVVASHDSTHADLVLAAISAGKPVMCEKPLAPTVQQCRDVVAAQDEALGQGGVPLVSLGFMRRFDPGYLQMKQALDAGGHGAPLVVHCISRGVSAAPGATDVSSITGSAIHEFDALPWLLGAPIVEVGWHAPRSSTQAVGFRDPQVMLLRTADGTLSTLEVFLNARYGYDVRCEIVCEQGTLALLEPARLVSDSSRARAVGYPDDWRPRFADAYRIELQAWADAVRDGRQSPLATAGDGLSAAVVAAAVITSMNEGGRMVPVVYPER
jgi:myo-inositol 2-dehydrogenase/D-chiro-inositol 1-dehydrogenase